MRVGVGRSEGRVQPPLHLAAELQRQPAAEHVASGPARLAHKHRPHFEQAGLHLPKVPLHAVDRQPLGTVRLETGDALSSLEA